MAKKKTVSMPGFRERYEQLREACGNDNQRLMKELRVLAEKSGQKKSEHWRLFFEAKIADLEEKSNEAIALYDELAKSFLSSTVPEEALVAA